MMIMMENMNQIMDGNNLEKELLNYFNKTNSRELEVLDNKYRKFYTGVSLNYLTYDLLKAKYKKSEIAKCLLNLHKTGKIKSIFCKDVNKYVFESEKSFHRNFNIITGYNYGGKNLHEYLKQFIKNKNE